MVVVPPVRNHGADAEETMELLEADKPGGRLRHGELVKHLEAGLAASTPGTPRLPNEADGEASFSFYKTDHPAAELGRPFLLVFRTRHVVTTVDIPSDVTVSSAGFTGFSSI